MNYWKIMVGALAIMWGTKSEMAAIESQVNGAGGNARVERCTQQDIDAICNRGWM